MLLTCSFIGKSDQTCSGTLVVISLLCGIYRNIQEYLHLVLHRAREAYQ